MYEKSVQKLERVNRVKVSEGSCFVWEEVQLWLALDQINQDLCLTNKTMVNVFMSSVLFILLVIFQIDQFSIFLCLVLYPRRLTLHEHSCPLISYYLWLIESTGMKSKVRRKKIGYIPLIQSFWLLLYPTKAAC